MKLKEIHYQITKNIGNFESVKLGATFDVEKNDLLAHNVQIEGLAHLQESYNKINDKLQTAFDSIFKENVFVEAPQGERVPLTLNTVEFDRVRASIVAKRATIEDVEKHYYIDIDVMKELIKLTTI